MRDFLRYLRELASGAWGIVGNISLAVTLVAFYVPALSVAHWALWSAVIASFLASSFSIYRRHLRLIVANDAAHDAEARRLRADMDQLKAREAKQLQEYESGQRAVAGAAAEATRLESEIGRLQSEIAALRAPRFSETTRRLGEQHYARLTAEQRAAVRLLALGGDTTDRLATEQLKREGLIPHNYMSALSGLADQSPLIQRVQHEPQRGEHVRGYTGLYTINPTFKDVLEEIIAREPVSVARAGV